MTRLPQSFPVKERTIKNMADAQLAYSELVRGLDEIYRILRDETATGSGTQGPRGLQGLTGPQGATGATGAAGTNGTNGADGADGADGVGVPVGGTTGQILVKKSNTNYDTEWKDIKDYFLLGS